MNNNYKLRYLPLFYEDFNEKIAYIRNILQNKKAADDLIDEVEKAILNRLPVCESFEKYKSKKERKHPYYRIYVKNFIIFYVVIKEDKNKIMEVRRVLYNKENINTKI